MSFKELVISIFKKVYIYSCHGVTEAAELGVWESRPHPQLPCLHLLNPLFTPPKPLVYGAKTSSLREFDALSYTVNPPVFYTSKQVEIIFDALGAP